MYKVKNIAVFTCIRSEYGVMVPILKRLANHSELKLFLLVGGAHLLEEHNYTIKEIENDGFQIAQTFPFLFTDKGNTVNTRSIAMLQLQMGEYLANHRPDMILLVGDRFELLPVANVALLLNIPIGHISGGDVTEGLIDNQIRNAISKMAHVHFPSTQTSKNNLLKIGEEEWRIQVTGAPCIDCINSTNFIEKTILYSELKLAVNSPLVITTFHPETLNNRVTSQFLNTLFEKIISKDYEYTPEPSSKISRNGPVSSCRSSEK